MRSELAKSEDIEGQLAVQAIVAGSRYRHEVTRRLLQGRSFAQIAEDRDLAPVLRAGLGKVEQILESCQRSSLTVIPFSSPRYPILLAASASPPLALFIRSHDTLSSFATESIAIVGSRSAGLATCQAASQLAFDLAQAGVTVVSGLALGIDGAAHRGALQSKHPTPTIAVMAHGLDTVYPRSHEYLARSIFDHGGALISEYPPGTEPLKHHFLERNRIIAGLVRGVVVFQAGERSGSLVTATYAAEYGRDVFVPVEPQLEADNRGGERLRDDGAISIADANDILREYGLNRRSVAGEASNQGTSPEPLKIVSADELHRIAEGSMTKLLEWELEGRVVRVSGGRFAIRDALRH